MKKILLITSLIFIVLFSGCNSDDSSDSEDYLIVDGIRQSLAHQTDATIYFSGGGFTHDPQTGNTTSVYTMLNILDPNQSFLPNFNQDEFTESLRLRFVIQPDTSTGIHSTINNSMQVDEDEVIAEYFVDGQESVYALPGQNIKMHIENSQIKIVFTNVTFGSHVISGQVTMGYYF